MLSPSRTAQFIALTLALTLFGCAAEGDLPDAENQIPIANAGDGRAVTIGETITASGAASLDPDADPMTYRWDLQTPAGSQARLSSANFVDTEFEADLVGEYRLSLVVNDGLVDSVPDMIIFTAALSDPNNQENREPVAAAGPDQNVQVGMTVQLDGTASTDKDGDPLFFDWILEGRPDGSTVELSSKSAPKPTFMPDVAGMYEISLVVDDGIGRSQPDTVIIEAFSGNTPPSADAGPDQTVATGSRVQLDGSRSVDSDGDTLTFVWSMVERPTGSQAALSDLLSVNPVFDADRDGEYVVELVVQDGMASSVADSITIIATTENVPPVAHSGTDQQVPVGDTVQLDGGLSSDANDDALNYQWSLKSMPTGSVASLSNPTAEAPTFVADVEGVYIAELKVDDGQAQSLPDSVTVTATLNNVAPVADAGPDQNVVTGVTVQLDGGMSSDADSDPLTYAWTLTAKPAASLAMLSSATGAQPTIIPDVDGTYVVQLVVNDGNVDSASDSMVITAATAANPPPASLGDIVITEVMINPDALGDSTGEWFELYNPSASVTYDLQNCVIEDLGADRHTIGGSLVMAPGQRVTMARNANPGFTPDYIYSGFQLGNSEDEIILSCNAVGIADAAWGPVFGPNFPVVAGASASLLDDMANESANDVDTNWCVSTNVYNMVGTKTDKGTPGLANGFQTVCP